MAGGRIPIALTIAGSDSSGGAGIQADLKTFSALGVYAASAITALTAQNTCGVQGVEPVRAAFIVAQLDSILADLEVGAAKTGMLATGEVVEAVVARLEQAAALPLIADPVMVATSGDVLLAAEAVAAVRSRLLPRATLITPNLPEAARLLDTAPAAGEGEQVAQAKALLALGPRAVLVKGGHGGGREAVDVLCVGDSVHRFARPRIDTPHTHGTGCTLSAAIAALTACGVPLVEAVSRGKDYVWQALSAGRSLGVGHGRGPVDHLFAIRCGAPAA
jgi:hydroxymethylpyrimidine/phosphomethylpyrimidine kinase